MSRKQTNESKMEEDEPIDFVYLDSLRAPNSTLRLRGAEIRQKTRKTENIGGREWMREGRVCLASERGRRWQL